MKATQASLYLFARAEEEGKKPRSSGSIKLGYGASEIDIESCINEAAKKTLDHLFALFSLSFLPDSF